MRKKTVASASYHMPQVAEKEMQGLIISQVHGCLLE